MPGQRSISIEASDGRYLATVSLTVAVTIINNNPPVLSFRGSDRAAFVENSSQPLMVGRIFQPAIADPDNNSIFLMEAASVALENAPDGEMEVIGVAGTDVATLSQLNISVDGKLQLEMTILMLCGL